MIEVRVNGEQTTLPQAMTIAEFIDWSKQDGNFAVAVNMEFVPRSLYGKTLLKANDSVDIVLPMQGG